MLRAYTADLLAAAPRRVWTTLALMGCVGVTEGIGLLLLVPLLEVAGLDVGHGGMEQIQGWASAAFDTLGARPTLLTVLAVYVGVVSLRSWLRRWQMLVGSELDEGFLLHLRTRLYRSILGARWRFLTHRRGSDFMHVLSTELERVGELSYALFSLLIGALLVSVYLLVALHLSAPTTAFALASGIGLLLLLRRHNAQAQLAGEELTRATESLFAASSEQLSSLKTAKSYATEEQDIHAFTSIAARVARAEVATTRNYADAGAWFGVGSVVILAVAVWIALGPLELATAEVLLLLFVFSRLVPKFSGLQQDYQSVVNALPAYANVRDQIARCEAAAEPIGGAAVSKPLERELRLERVSFSYRCVAGFPALREVDLSLPARQTTALTGPSGSGKTTIADVVMGLLVPDRGRVLVDGTPLDAHRIRAWRASIGYVAQDSVLFHASFRANLLWACPDASDDDIWEALRLAAADHFVARSPDGLETVIGDRGVRLSGGEKQRLALARALLRRPSLLILDEATSALDSENERRIRRATEQLHGRLTILLITHRLATLRAADRIHLVEDGSIVESGSWDELSARGHRFVELCSAQGIDPTSPQLQAARRFA